MFVTHSPVLEAAIHACLTETIFDTTTALINNNFCSQTEN